MGKPTFYTGLICNIYMDGQLGTRRTDYCALRVHRDYGNILVRHQSFLRHGNKCLKMWSLVSQEPVYIIGNE